MLTISANRVIMRGYIAAATYQEEKTFHLSINSGANSLAWIIGPAIQVHF